MTSKGIQILTAGILAFSTVFVASVAVTNNIEAATNIGCRCGVLNCDGSCGFKGLLRRKSVCCPSCDAEICELKTEETKEKKTCYKVEQKTICIPAVRLPWQACAPTTSSSRKVNVLKKHSYECPSCKYSWSVVKPITVPVDNAQPVDNAPPIEPTINSGARNIRLPWTTAKPASADSSNQKWNLFKTPNQQKTEGYSPENFLDSSSILWKED